MSCILYTSNKSFFVKKDTGVAEFSSEKIVNYINTAKSIMRKNEWKTSGAGARFMSTYEPEYSDETAKKETRLMALPDMEKKSYTQRPWARSAAYIEKLFKITWLRDLFFPPEMRRYIRYLLLKAIVPQASEKDLNGILL